jgi:transcriptional regulator with XRE-family HTH domain
MTRLGEMLKQTRKDKNIMQKDAAERLSLPLRTYQSYEYGEVEPNSATMRKLADMFGVTVDYLLGRGDVSGIIITLRIRAVLDDRHLSLEAKGLYMQLYMYSADGKFILADEDSFLEENNISSNEFQRITGELVKAGYLKITADSSGATIETEYNLI